MEGLVISCSFVPAVSICELVDVMELAAWDSTAQKEFLFPLLPFPSELWSPIPQEPHLILFNFI